jgi:hypothetical protein
VPNGRFALSPECLLTFLGEREIACYSRSLDRQRWTRLAPKAWSSFRPYAWNQMALAGDDTGELIAFRLADGEAVWSIVRRDDPRHRNVPRRTLRRDAEGAGLRASLANREGAREEN